MQKFLIVIALMMLFVTAALADTLLRPFVVEEPPPEVRKIIEIELLNRLDDPRLAAGRWAGVSETAKEVMLRWLAEATLEAFIAIVRKYADPGHWVYREAFWRAYLRAGYVRSVQVAFKPLAAQEARHAEAMAGLHADQSRLLNHLAGVTAAEAVADSTAMEDALAKLLQKQMLDPLSAAIQSAQDEDAANFLLRQQEQQEAIQRELSQMSAQATIPMI